MSGNAIKQSFWRITDQAHLPDELSGAVVAIGNFDGVHKGHQAVLHQALKKAKDLNKPALVYTFEPHPRSFFNPKCPVFRLTDATQKAEYFQKMGFNGVIEQPFTAEFAHMPAKDFVQHILCEKLAISSIIAGSNFHFGYKRQGTPAFLQQAGNDMGFETELVDGLIDKTGEFISSSRIRNLLEVGDIKNATPLLGHPYSIQKYIISGQALGRQLGFPTANMQLAHETRLKHGIYAVYFRLKNTIYEGVASFGRRPTVETDGKPLLETYIFDFSDDIYDELAEVFFVDFLRGEEKFANTEELTKQMQRDAETAKDILKQNPLDLTAF